MRKLRYNTFPKSFDYCVNPEYHGVHGHKFKTPETHWLPYFGKKELKIYNDRVSDLFKVDRLCLYAIPNWK